MASLFSSPSQIAKLSSPDLLRDLDLADDELLYLLDLASAVKQQGRNTVREEVSPEDLGLNKTTPDMVAGGDPEQNARLTAKLLSGQLNQDDPRVQTVAANAAVVLAVSACSDGTSPVAPILPGPSVRSQINGNEPPAPSGVLTVTLGGESLSMWPFTGSDFSGAPQDPINLIFLGKADPREIRASLMSLSGTGRPGPLVGSPTPGRPVRAR